MMLLSPPSPSFAGDFSIAEPLTARWEAIRAQEYTFIDADEQDISLRVHRAFADRCPSPFRGGAGGESRRGRGCIYSPSVTVNNRPSARPNTSGK